MPELDVVVFHIGYVACQVGKAGGTRAEFDEIDAVDLMEVVAFEICNIIDPLKVELDANVGNTVGMVDEKVDDDGRLVMARRDDTAVEIDADLEDDDDVEEGIDVEPIVTQSTVVDAVISDENSAMLLATSMTV